MFDLLLGNLDRFHEPSSRKIEYLNFENIDFRKHGNRYELVPLDNFSIYDRLSRDISDFKEAELKCIGTLDLRTEYANDVVTWLLGEIQIDRFRQIPELRQAFLDGMHETLKSLRNLPIAGLHRNRLVKFLLDRLSLVD